MRHADGVRRAERGTDRPNDAGRARFGERSVPDQIPQAAAVDVLNDEIQRAVLQRADVENADHRRVIDPRERSLLLFETGFDDVDAGGFRTEYFDDDAPGD